MAKVALGPVGQRLKVLLDTFFRAPWGCAGSRSRFALSDPHVLDEAAQRDLAPKSHGWRGDRSSWSLAGGSKSGCRVSSPPRGDGTYEHRHRCDSGGDRRDGPAGRRDRRTVRPSRRRWRSPARSHPRVRRTRWVEPRLPLLRRPGWPALRRALHHRDRGCRFPGCHLPFGQGHHIRHWAQGGPTTLSNLAMLCRRHHRAAHEEGYHVERQPDGELRFRRPDGWALPDVPPSPAVPRDPVQALRARNEATGLQVNARTACPGWWGERLDVGWAIDVLHPRARQPAVSQ